MLALVLAATLAAAGLDDPCAAARAPLPPGGAPADVVARVGAYRQAWRRACDPEAITVQLAPLLSEAETLTNDVRLAKGIETMAAAVAIEAGAPWPFPAIVRAGDGGLYADWRAFAAAAGRGTADDQRFWRVAVLVAGALGEPAWTGSAVDAEAPTLCVRLGEVDWSGAAAAIEELHATRVAVYADHAERLHDALVETLTAIADGPDVCGCLRGDAGAGLEALSTERRAGGARRSVGEPAASALEALRSGKTRVRWQREYQGGAPMGCGW